MERLTPPTLAAAILDAPAWAKIGLTLPDEAMRQRAADALAGFLLDKIGDERQLALPIP